MLHSFSDFHLVHSHSLLSFILFIHSFAIHSFFSLLNVCYVLASLLGMGDATVRMALQMLMGHLEAGLRGQGRLPGGGNISVAPREGAGVSLVEWCLIPIEGSLPVEV